MAQPVLSRSQRRIEKKQTLLILVMIVIVAGVSFFLGVLVGQKSRPLPGFSDEVNEVRLPTASQVVPAPPAPEPEPAAEPAQLTFYDNLPKGDQAPLGSGINLPPEDEKVAIPAIAPAKVKKTTKAAVAAPVPERQAASPKPAASAQGTFVVQVASFRTTEDARKLQTRLDKHGLTTFQERADLGQKGTWFRVLAGPYAERTDADRVVALIKVEEKMSGLVRKR